MSFFKSFSISLEISPWLHWLCINATPWDYYRLLPQTGWRSWKTRRDSSIVEVDSFLSIKQTNLMLHYQCQTLYQTIHE